MYVYPGSGSYPGANETTGYPPYLVPNGGEGNDGAPEWAVETDGLPAWAVLGIGQLNLAIMRAYQVRSPRRRCKSGRSPSGPTPPLHSAPPSLAQCPSQCAPSLSPRPPSPPLHPPQNFYENKVVPGVPQGAAPGPGLQDHYLGAVAARAARFATRSAVLGIETINEPQPGATLDPFTFAREFLFPLHRRIIHAVTGERDGLPTCPVNETARTDCAYPDLGIRDTRHVFLLEPNALRNTLDFAPQVSAPVSNYSNILYSPHTYTHVFTIDRVLSSYGINISWYPPSFEFAYQTAWGEANAMGLGVFVTEFGSSPGDDPTTVGLTMDAQDAFMTGGTLWSWKSNCVSSNGDCGWAWTVYFPFAEPVLGPIPQNRALDPERAWLLSRTQVRAAAGELLAYGFNRTTRSYSVFANVTAAAWARLQARGAAAGAAAGAAPRHVAVSARDYAPRMAESFDANGTTTEVFIPANIPFAVAVAGTAQLLSVVTWPDGSRSAYVQPTGAGVYSVLVTNATAAAGAAGEGAVAAAADTTATTPASTEAAFRRFRAAQLEGLAAAGAARRRRSSAASPASAAAEAAVCGDARSDATLLPPGTAALHALGAEDARRAQCAYDLWLRWLRASVGAALDVGGVDRRWFTGL